MWLFFTLATTLLWGLAELFYKKGSHEDQKYDHLRVCVLVGAVMGIHAVFTLLTSDIAYNPMNLIAYLPVSLCYILSMACSFFGIRFIEESLADPIENTSGAMCSIMCVVFLGDTISLPVWIAIAIIVVGIIGVTQTEKSAEVNRSQKLGKKLATVAFLMPFCYAFIDAIGYVNPDGSVTEGTDIARLAVPAVMAIKEGKVVGMLVKEYFYDEEKDLLYIMGDEETNYKEEYLASLEELMKSIK